jgi:hypothetical protein
MLFVAGRSKSPLEYLKMIAAFALALIVVAATNTACRKFLCKRKRPRPRLVANPPIMFFATMNGAMGLRPRAYLGATESPQLQRMPLIVVDVSRKQDVAKESLLSCLFIMYGL